jgi:ABC-type branched-subunit amino acid transport system substrate-binding protein
LSRFVACLVVIFAIGGSVGVMAADEVVVGAVTPFSGNLSVYGVNLQKAMFVALDEVFGAFNYDMVMLAAKTLSGAASDDPAAIRTALIAAADNYIGASGEKTFDKNGQSPGTFGAWMVRNGRIVDFNPRP